MNLDLSSLSQGSQPQLAAAADNNNNMVENFEDMQQWLESTLSAHDSGNSNSLNDDELDIDDLMCPPPRKRSLSNAAFMANAQLDASSPSSHNNTSNDASSPSSVLGMASACMDSSFANMIRRNSLATSTPSSSKSSSAFSMPYHPNNNASSAFNSTSNMMSSSSSKKRTRASPEQLAILEETFQNNTSPNSKMRELLGEKLGMNERSIQIWFQNRRAKVKLMQKRAQSPHDPHAAMRQQSMFAATYGIFGNAAAGGVGASSANGGYLKPNMPMSRSQSVDFTGLQQLNMQQMTMPLKMGQEALLMKGLTGATSSSGSNPSNTIAQTGLCKLSGEALSIGTWRRVALAPEDLDCKINLLEKSVRWQIMESGSRFKIEFPLQSVSSLKFETTDGISGQITAELIQAPQFFMEIVNMSAGNPTWTQCRDFTEGHQATTIFRHVLRGSASAMQEELMALASADPYLQGIIQIASIQGINSNDSQNDLSKTTSDMLSSLLEGSGMMVPNMMRRGSCPAPASMNSFDSLNSSNNGSSNLLGASMNNPMNRLRRGSMFEATFSPHSVESPLMSPLTSPLSSPLTAPINSALSDIASPSHANLFSPNLNDAFSGLVVLDEFNFETPGFATPSLENILDFKIKPISTSTEGILEDNLRSNTGDSSLSAGATTPTSSNSDFSSSNGVGNASNNSPSTPDNNSQELPIVTGHTVAAGMNVSSVKQPQQQSQQVSVGAGMSMEGMSNSDFLFDIAQFLDSTSSQLNN